MKNKLSFQPSLVFTIPPLDGSECLYSNKELFTSFIDKAFASHKSRETGYTTVNVYNIPKKNIQQMAVSEIFQALPGDCESKALSEHQIAYICREFKASVLSVDGIALFFSKENEEEKIDEVLNNLRPISLQNIRSFMEGLSVWPLPLTSSLWQASQLSIVVPA